jgi:hypothetical protein
MNTRCQAEALSKFTKGLNHKNLEVVQENFDKMSIEDRKKFYEFALRKFKMGKILPCPWGVKIPKKKKKFLDLKKYRLKKLD